MRSTHLTEPVVSDNVPPELRRELARVYELAGSMRRRRRRVIPASATVLFVALILVFGLVGPLRSEPSATGRSPGYPPVFVAYQATTFAVGQSSLSSPVSVVLVSSTTGHVVRVLVDRVPIEGGLALAPDGRTVYYSTVFDVSSSGAEYAIDAIPSLGGTSRQVALGTNPAISPDGRYLAYWLDPQMAHGVSGKLAVLDLQTGSTRTFAVRTNDNGQPPVWAGDSHEVATMNQPCRGAAALSGCVDPGVSFAVVDLNAPTGARPQIGFLPTNAIWPELFVGAGLRPGTLVASFPTAPGQPSRELDVVDVALGGTAPPRVASLPGRYGPGASVQLPYLESVSASGRYGLVLGLPSTSEQFEVIDLDAGGRVITTLSVGSSRTTLSGPTW